MIRAVFSPQRIPGNDAMHRPELALTAPGRLLSIGSVDRLSASGWRVEYREAGEWTGGRPRHGRPHPCPVIQQTMSGCPGSVYIAGAVFRLAVELRSSAQDSRRACPWSRRRRSRSRVCAAESACLCSVLVPVCLLPTPSIMNSCFGMTSDVPTPILHPYADGCRCTCVTTH